MTTIKLSLAAFLAFAQSKPANEEYPAWDGSNCALAQFLAHTYPNVEFDGRRVGWSEAISVAGDSYDFDPNNESYDIARAIARAIDYRDRVTGQYDYTWGGLADRLALIEVPALA